MDNRDAIIEQLRRGPLNSFDAIRRRTQHGALPLSADEVRELVAYFKAIHFDKHKATVDRLFAAASRT